MTISADDIAGAVSRCGVAPGATLFLHSDALVTAQLPPLPAAGRFDLLFDALEGALGPNGTLVLPTFTYSATRGEVFEPAASPSTVGLLTEHFRGRPGVSRSRDPIFSVAASGARAAEYAAATVDDSFGPGSAFDLLLRHDGWIACLGCALDRVTFVHHVEQTVGVDYRYFKTFPGRILDDGRLGERPVRFFVRDLNRDAGTDLERLKRRLRERGGLAVEPVGRVALMAVRARDFMDEARALLREDPVALIREGRRPEGAQP